MQLSDDLAGYSPAIVHDRHSDCYYGWANATFLKVENEDPEVPDTASPEFYILRNHPPVQITKVDQTQFTCNYELTTPCKLYQLLGPDGLGNELSVLYKDNDKYILALDAIWPFSGWYVVAEENRALWWQNPVATTNIGVQLMDVTDPWVYSLPEQNWTCPVPYPLNTVLRGFTDGELPADSRNGYVVGYKNVDTETAQFPYRLHFNEWSQSYGLIPIFPQEELAEVPTQLRYMCLYRNTFYWRGRKPMLIEMEEDEEGAV